jgi:beta-glucanase (GH16 family)
MKWSFYRIIKLSLLLLLGMLYLITPDIFTKAAWSTVSTIKSTIVSLPTIMTGTNPSHLQREKWKLIWHDEFDGTKIDITKWQWEVNAWGGGNNELQYYTDRPNNSFIHNGTLVIQAQKERFSGPEGTRDYTSARLRTLDCADWCYGRFEIRAKLPAGRGLWPAIWLLPSKNVYGGWAASGEIDIMELLGHEPQTVYGTLHYGGEWPDNKHSGSSFTLNNSSFSDDFHVFCLEWASNEFRWYVDDQLYQTQSKWYTTKSVYPAPFNRDFYLILNVAVGGDWPGVPDENTSFPQSMIIDYVRVYNPSRQ